jgi:hypothetical protein
MGTQQLLLISLAVVVGVIMIAIGLVMFRDQAASQNRDSVSGDMVYFASQARKYYRRPAVLGGGDHSFGGLRMRDITSRPTNANGIYTLVPDPVPEGEQVLKIVGMGKEHGLDDSTVVKITMSVTPDSVLMVTEN